MCCLSRNLLVSEIVRQGKFTTLQPAIERMLVVLFAGLFGVLRLNPYDLPAGTRRPIVRDQQSRVMSSGDSLTEGEIDTGTRL
jgi:hypothetical protein